MTPRLFHVSDDPNIKVFAPRVHPTWKELGPRMWAIEERLLSNYLLPRDCPRITYYAVDTSTGDDVDRYLGGNRTNHVVRVENAWLNRINNARLYLYRLPPETFSSFDQGAGYWVSDETVVPGDVEEVNDLITVLTKRRVDFAALTNLWPLHDAVAASTLQFSMIRMRFAQSR